MMVVREDPSWNVLPVVHPDLPERKRRRLAGHAFLKDPIGLPKPEYQLRDRDQIVVPSALDRACRELLIRVQDAIDLALESRDGESGLRDTVPEGTLRRHEWDIAVALRDISHLRAEYGLNAAASVGPMTDAVLESHRLALQRAADSIAARVAELERYAECVRAAETAYRDWQDALRVSDLNDRYLDLVARTAADEHAVAEISGLTEQATSAARVFQETARQVSLAAAGLMLGSATQAQALGGGAEAR